MAKEGSVAPRERVNIVYKPATGDAQEEKELPLKLLMIGDYAMRQDSTPLEERKPININKDNFSDVMKSQKLEVSVNIGAIHIRDLPKVQLEVFLDGMSLGVQDFTTAGWQKRTYRNRPSGRRRLGTRDPWRAHLPCHTTVARIVDVQPGCCGRGGDGHRQHGGRRPRRVGPVRQGGGGGVRSLWCRLNGLSAGLAEAADPCG